MLQRRASLLLILPYAAVHANSPPDDLCVPRLDTPHNGLGGNVNIAPHDTGIPILNIRFPYGGLGAVVVSGALEGLEPGETYKVSLSKGQSCDGGVLSDGDVTANGWGRATLDLDLAAGLGTVDDPVWVVARYVSLEIRKGGHVLKCGQVFAGCLDGYMADDGLYKITRLESGRALIQGAVENLVAGESYRVAVDAGESCDKLQGDYWEDEAKADCGYKEFTTAEGCISPWTTAEFPGESGATRFELTVDLADLAFRRLNNRVLRVIPMSEGQPDAFCGALNFSSAETAAEPRLFVTQVAVRGELNMPDDLCVRRVNTFDGAAGAGWAARDMQVAPNEFGAPMLKISFHQLAGETRVSISGRMTGLEPNEEYKGHIHSGSDCSTSASQGGHYVEPYTELPNGDPWDGNCASCKFTADENGEAEVDIAVTYSKTMYRAAWYTEGRVFVIHKFVGGGAPRAACGRIVSGCFAGYVASNITVIADRSEADSDMPRNVSNSGDLRITRPWPNAIRIAGELRNLKAAAAHQIHIHSGTGCAAADVGAHYWEKIEGGSDPWVATYSKFMADDDGRAKIDNIWFTGFQSDNTYNRLDGRTVAVHVDGKPPGACGLIDVPAYGGAINIPRDLCVRSLGNSNDIKIAANVAGDAALRIAYSADGKNVHLSGKLQGLQDCDKHLIEIHDGNSCDTDVLQGERYYMAESQSAQESAADPWISRFEQRGGLNPFRSRNGIAYIGLTVPNVDLGLNGDMAKRTKGRVVVILKKDTRKPFTSTRVACGVIEDGCFEMAAHTVEYRMNGRPRRRPRHSMEGRRASEEPFLKREDVESDSQGEEDEESESLNEEEDELNAI